MNHWLLKSEGTCYSIDDFKKDKKTAWTGIRNYQASNFMRDSMKVGDLCLFYHSSSDPTGVFGIAKVSSKPHLDTTATDPKDEHYEPKHTWICVDVSFVKKFAKPITLARLRIDPKLEGMVLLQKGSRLSIQPVSEKHFKYITEVLVQ